MYLSNSIIDLNVKYKSLKLLNESMGDNEHDLDLGKDLLDIMPKA
jgi:hypothetical protein